MNYRYQSDVILTTDTINPSEPRYVFFYVVHSGNLGGKEEILLNFVRFCHCLGRPVLRW